MSLNSISADFTKIHNQHLSGKLAITDGKSVLAHLYFFSGRLVHCASEHHRVRRLYRAIQRHSQSFQPILKEYFVGLDNHYLWDFYGLSKAIELGTLTKDKGKNVIQNLVQEIFYNLASARKLEAVWSDKNYPSQAIALLVPQEAIDLALKSRAKWQEAGLGHVENLIPHFSLDMAAIITGADRLQAMVAAEAIEKDYSQILVTLLNGQNTIWDLSIMMRKSLVSVMRSLLPLAIDGILEFRDIPDLTAPVKMLSNTFQIQRATKGLVACIDDSLQIGEEMEQMLTKAGYESMFISDPLQGMSELLKRKPDLIFLDLIMPNTNGYEFCTFLRKTTQFKQVPIVILTGNDGVIDRVRAKMAGASDFMGKPPDASKILQILEKYITVPESQS